MRKRALAAAVLLCLIAVDAEARPRHHRHHAGAPGRPASCYGIPWCGCWLRVRYSMPDTRLNKASEWGRLGTAANVCRVGQVAVWPHHVGEVTECLGGGMIRMISGNDSGAVRDRIRPLGRGRLRDL